MKKLFLLLFALISLQGIAQSQITKSQVTTVVNSSLAVPIKPAGIKTAVNKVRDFAAQADSVAKTKVNSADVSALINSTIGTTTATAISTGLAGKANVSDLQPSFQSFIGNVGATNTSNYTDYFYLTGDSITDGANANPRSVYAFSRLITSALRLQEVNYAISGTTLVKFANGDNSGIDRLASITPTYVTGMQGYMMGYGTNDFNNIGGTYNAANFRAAYYTFIDALVAKGWPLNKIILWLPFNGTTSSGALNTLVQDIALQKGVVFMNIWQYMADNGGMSLISNDSLHPLNGGHIAIAKSFLINTTLPKYDYSIFNQDILSTGKIYAGKGIYGGSQLDGLELHGTNGNNSNSKITSFDAHNFKKKLVLENSVGGLVTPSSIVDFGQAYTTGIGSYANAFIKWYNNTYIGVSDTDGLTFGSGAGAGAIVRITLKNTTYLDDNVVLGQNFNDAQVTPKRIRSGAYVAGPITNLNTIYQMYGGAGMGASNSEGLVLTAVGSGLQQQITLKNNTKIFGSLTTDSNLTIGATIAATGTASPASIDLGSSFSSVAGQNLKVKLYLNAGFGISVNSLDYRSIGVHSFYKDDTKIAEIADTGMKAPNFTATSIPEYADNAAALAASLPVGRFYRTGDLLKVVH